MATEVYTTEIIRLLDETEVELRPLAIAKLRKFMRLWSDHLKDISKKFAEDEAKPEEEQDFDNAALTDAQFDVFIKMCALGLESQIKGDRTEKQFLAHLEDILDEKTIHKILETTGGLSLNSPNQTPPVNLPAGAGTD